MEYWAEQQDYPALSVMRLLFEHAVPAVRDLLQAMLRSACRELVDAPPLAVNGGFPQTPQAEEILRARVVYGLARGSIMQSLGASAAEIDSTLALWRRKIPALGLFFCDRREIPFDFIVPSLKRPAGFEHRASSPEPAELAGLPRGVKNFFKLTMTSNPAFRLGERVALYNALTAACADRLAAHFEALPPRERRMLQQRLAGKLAITALDAAAAHERLEHCAKLAARIGDVIEKTWPAEVLAEFYYLMFRPECAAVDGAAHEQTLAWVRKRTHVLRKVCEHFAALPEARREPFLKNLEQLPARLEWGAPTCIARLEYLLASFPVEDDPVEP